MLITTTGNFKLGEKVVCKGEVTIPSSKRNFYLFDYQKYLASKQIYYTMKGECEAEDTSTSLFYSIKSKIIERIEKMESFPYLKAFLLGDNKDISENVKESYQRNGISHLFSVSGMHITFFFLIFRFFIKSEKIRNSFLFIFLLFYLFLTNFSPSVISASRFTISFFLLLFSKSLGQEKNYLKNLLKVSVISLMASIPIQIETNFSFNILSPFYNLFFVPIISNFLFPVSFLVFLFPFLDAFYFFLFSILESVSLQLVKIPSILILCHIPWVGVILYYVIFSFVMHKIIKKEYGTEKCLSGVKFNLLDKNKDVVMENLVTDENGEITLENMLPGMYYICEIETLDGYNLYTDLIDVDLDLNEEFEVTVNNTTREITEIDKTFENVEVIPQYTETVYNVENRATILKENNIKKLPVTGY